MDEDSAGLGRPPGDGNCVRKPKRPFLKRGEGTTNKFQGKINYMPRRKSNIEPSDREHLGFPHRVHEYEDLPPPPDFSLTTSVARSERKEPEYVEDDEGYPRASADRDKQDVPVVEKLRLDDRESNSPGYRVPSVPRTARSADSGYPHEEGIAAISPQSPVNSVFSDRQHQPTICSVLDELHSSPAHRVDDTRQFESMERRVNAMTRGEQEPGTSSISSDSRQQSRADAANFAEIKRARERFERRGQSSLTEVSSNGSSNFASIASPLEASTPIPTTRNNARLKGDARETAILQGSTTPSVESTGTEPESDYSEERRFLANRDRPMNEAYPPNLFTGRQIPMNRASVRPSQSTQFQHDRRSQQNRHPALDTSSSFAISRATSEDARPRLEKVPAHGDKAMKPLRNRNHVRIADPIIEEETPKPIPRLRARPSENATTRHSLMNRLEMCDACRGCKCYANASRAIFSLQYQLRDALAHCDLAQANLSGKNKKLMAAFDDALARVKQENADVAKKANEMEKEMAKLQEDRRLWQEDRERQQRQLERSRKTLVDKDNEVLKKMINERTEDRQAVSDVHRKLAEERVKSSKKDEEIKTLTTKAEKQKTELDRLKNICDLRDRELVRQRKQLAQKEEELTQMSQAPLVARKGDRGVGVLSTFRAKSLNKTRNDSGFGADDTQNSSCNCSSSSLPTTTNTVVQKEPEKRPLSRKSVSFALPEFYEAENDMVLRNTIRAPRGDMFMYTSESDLGKYTNMRYLTHPLLRFNRLEQRCGAVLYDYSNADQQWLHPSGLVQLYYYASEPVFVVKLPSLGVQIRHFHSSDTDTLEVIRPDQQITRFERNSGKRYEVVRRKDRKERYLVVFEADHTYEIAGKSDRSAAEDMMTLREGTVASPLEYVEWIGKLDFVLCRNRIPGPLSSYKVAYSYAGDGSKIILDFGYETVEITLVPRLDEAHIKHVEKSADTDAGIEKNVCCILGKPSREETRQHERATRQSW